MKIIFIILLTLLVQGCSESKSMCSTYIDKARKDQNLVYLTDFVDKELFNVIVTNRYHRSAGGYGDYDLDASFDWRRFEFPDEDGVVSISIDNLNESVTFNNVISVNVKAHPRVAIIIRPSGVDKWVANPIEKLSNRVAIWCPMGK